MLVANETKSFKQNRKLKRNCCRTRFTLDLLEQLCLLQTKLKHPNTISKRQAFTSHFTYYFNTVQEPVDTNLVCKQ